MTDAEKIDKTLADLRIAGQTEAARQKNPVEHERNPPSFQRQQEKERSDSSWAGSSWGGRSR